MRSLKTILTILVLVPILVIGGIKGYMHYKLKKEMDKVEAASRFFGRLRYGDLSTSLTGRIGVHNIRLQINGLDDIIHIKSIYYTPPNLWFLLKDANKLDQGELPERMKLSIVGLSMDLYGDITDRVDSVIKELNAEMEGVSKLCGGRLFIGPHEYRDMGYEEISLDTSIGYWHDKLNKEVVIELDTNMQDMASAKVSAVVTGIIDKRFDRLIHAKEPPRLSRMKLTYTDNSYTTRFVKMCANESKLSRQEYIDAEVNQKPAYFANTWGIVPGKGLRAAYKDFLSKPGSIEVSMELPESVEYDKIDLFKAEDIPDLLDLKLSVNNKAIKDLSFSFNDQGRKRFEDRFSNLFDKDGEKKKPVKKNRNPELAHFYQVHVSRLPKYIGKEVRLQLEAGKRREGTLMKISGNTLYLNKRMQGGEFSVKVPVNRIKKAEVFLVKQQ